MGLSRNGLTIMNFDETYFPQTKLQEYPHEMIDLRRMQHVNLYCDPESMTHLNRQLQNRTHKGITFIGSGNYHYVSFLLLKEMTEPFTLVLFDNHPDLGTDQEHNLLSCGTWVSYALREIPLLQRVIIIGPTAILEHQINHPHVVIYPFDDRHRYSVKSILSAIPTQHVYISIDKDVLNNKEVITNWDQGIMNTRTLTQFLEAILRSKQVEGIDICGEASLSPLDVILPDYQAIIQKNENANLSVLQTCLNMTQQRLPNVFVH